MKCEECREMLWIYLEWETTPEESAAVKAHLAECQECRRTAAAHMGIMETLHSLPETELPEGFHAGLMQAIAVEAAGQAAEAAPEPAKAAEAAPVEWKVVRKTEILQKAKAEKEAERKRRQGWRRWSLVAAAALAVFAAGGVGGFLRMQHAPLESMQLTAAPMDAAEGVSDAADAGSAANFGQERKMVDNAAADMAAGEENGQAGLQAAGSVADLVAGGAAQGNAPAGQAEPAAGLPSPTVESPPASAALAPASEELLPAPAAPAYGGDMMLMRSMAEPEAENAVEETAEEGVFDDAAAETAKSGDSLTLRTVEGANVSAFLSRAVARNDGFEEGAGNGGSVLVMIPVENMAAFYEELQEIGVVEWQAQGQEEAGAMYRRVEIRLETE